MYKPVLDDYVIWKRKNVEGWVYYCDSEGEYISIEIAVKDKSAKQLADGTYHRKDHILIICAKHYWPELEFIKSRIHIKKSN